MLVKGQSFIVYFEQVPPREQVPDIDPNRGLLQLVARYQQLTALIAQLERYLGWRFNNQEFARTIGINADFIHSLFVAGRLPETVK